MATDKLAVLRTIRARAVDRARAALAACIDAENAAIGAIGAIDAAIPRERAATDQYSGEYNSLEAFAAWSLLVRTQRAASARALSAAKEQSARARDALAAARAEVRVVEQLIERRAEAERSRTEAAEAHALDDIIRARFRRHRQDIISEPI